MKQSAEDYQRLDFSDATLEKVMFANANRLLSLDF